MKLSIYERSTWVTQCAGIRMQRWHNMTAADSMRTNCLTASCCKQRTTAVLQMLTDMLAAFNFQIELVLWPLQKEVRRCAGALLKTSCLIYKSDPVPLSKTCSSIQPKHTAVYLFSSVTFMSLRYCYSLWVVILAMQLNHLLQNSTKYTMPAPLQLHKCPFLI